MPRGARERTWQQAARAARAVRAAAVARAGLPAAEAKVAVATEGRHMPLLRR